MDLAVRTTASPAAIWTIVVVAVVLLVFWLAMIWYADRHPYVSQRRLPDMPGPGAAMLPWVIGMKAAKLLMLSGDSVDAARALELGIVTTVVADDELDDESVRIASRLAANPPTAMKLTKLALNRTYERMGFLGAVNENYMISTVLNATAAYREQEVQRQEIPLKEFLRRRDSAGR